MENDLAGAAARTDKPVSAGRLLSRKRLERGFDLADAARATRIPLRHLEAIEQDNYDRLPAYPYAVGFVRNYAKYLGLAPDLVVSQFKSETTLMDPTLMATMPEPLDEGRMPSRNVVVLGLLGALAVAGVTAYFYTRQPGAPSTEAPIDAALPDETAAASVPTGTPVLSDTAAPPVGQPLVPAPATPLPETPPPAAPDATAVAAGPTTGVPALPGAVLPSATSAAVGISPVGVVLRANEDSWIKVSDGTAPSLYTDILKAGTTYTVPNVPGLTLFTGNAGGLDVFVNGRQLAPLGRKGTRLKGVPLTPADLQAWQARAGSPVQR